MSFEFKNYTRLFLFFFVLFWWSWIRTLVEFIIGYMNFDGLDWINESLKELNLGSWKNKDSFILEQVGALVSMKRIIYFGVNFATSWLTRRFPGWSCWEAKDLVIKDGLFFFFLMILFCRVQLLVCLLWTCSFYDLFQFYHLF